MFLCYQESLISVIVLVKWYFNLVINKNRLSDYPRMVLLAQPPYRPLT